MASNSPELEGLGTSPPAVTSRPEVLTSFGGRMVAKPNEKTVENCVKQLDGEGFFKNEEIWGTHLNEL